ncbi:MAG: ABC transporter ATP-binding protein [Candidatus Aminicenantes bacterium]|nr:ABC transporter ATP-binding protein [Candidatus Aminicenantes bacterium]
MTNIAIKIENLSKVYRLYDKNIDRLKEAIHPFKKKYHHPFYALKKLNITVKKGEILGIIGRNGSGKSTLAKIVSGVLMQSTGNCAVNGRVSPLLGVAGGFNPELTGVENIYLNGMIKGFSRKEMDAMLDDIISFADIGEFIYQPVKTYSSGMNARLGFAVAININPKILILDEVLSVGDELFKRKCFAKMEELFDSGCTVLFVSHSMSSVNEICSRAILIDKGELILEGPPKSVTLHYQKLLYAKEEKKDKIRNEIIQLNNNEEKKKKFASTVEEIEEKPAAKETEEVEKQEAYYIPEFIPQSTVIHKNYDVDIYDVQIKTLDGGKVNVLVTNEEYVYSYKIRFDMDIENVNFGMGIRSEKGFVLSWMKYPGTNRYLEDKITKKSNYLVEWYFTCSFLPGNYYVSAGLRSLKDGEIVFLNKIDDALVFKVQEDKKRQKGGIVDCKQYVNIKELDRE